MKPTTATVKSAGAADEGDLKGDERKEAEKNKEAARLWISGLEAVQRKLGIARVVDLSATPFFLSGSGYAEGTLFPWTVSDFSLMDAIECGIVKLPRVPVADNIPNADMPKFRNLWEHIKNRMPKKGRGKAKGLDPLSLPVELQTALEALYGHYEKTFKLWQEAKIRVPPCFIVVCNNTSTSKLVYDFISGSTRRTMTARTTLVNGRLPLFRNFQEDTGNPLARPHTLLIDSEQLESGDALDPNFRKMASDEIDRFRREIVERTGDRSQAENLTDQDLLREVMNTVGKEGRLGETDPLRGLRGHAHRRLGCQHRHARPGRPGLQHPAPLRTGHRPRPAPPVLRAERGEPVRRRVRRCPGHPVRFHGQTRHRAAATAPGCRPRPCRAPRPRRRWKSASPASWATGSNCRRSA